jgi:hypothetical protein
MRGRGVLFALLAVVAAAAAVLSFAALRDLATVCGFAASLAWLLPVVVDAGAAAGSLVWLGGRVEEPARRFARALALGLLGLSVAANALGHGLAAFAVAPPWWVVVVVSAIAPAVLGAVVHLAVLVGRPDRARTAESGAAVPVAAPAPVVEQPAHPAAAGRRPGRRTGRRLLGDYLNDARAALDAAERAGERPEPTPAWCRRTTGCSAGTSVKLAAALRAEHAGQTNGDRLATTAAGTERATSPERRAA